MKKLVYLILMLVINMVLWVLCEEKLNSFMDCQICNELAKSYNEINEWKYVPLVHRFILFDLNDKIAVENFLYTNLCEGMQMWSKELCDSFWESLQSINLKSNSSKIQLTASNNTTSTGSNNIALFGVVALGLETSITDIYVQL
ncbi:hypothetical protein DICPUDRAFT_152473 [Dictyostelium purpureum]|uniref:Saposin B-type domain-containing protein n=1 Tax=Dictyostelium purpureum TaxID=5786 RepID=F0ZLG2_DICPU|nr:uncharacterized protein DICPUDRAFT_152473 [Dictyostelium purpureum]EGC35215.1 hypothetical protein DICPUDRAFT_152473 [Dictyostelium purpureum]|eukprot:XP_003288253.1 hypothetical protein DICPUDRAFT_152473 [Dictyostelium purpureum]